ncbi:hypothetical protein ACGF13_06555 [Kitasatospora sp. NPDC048286]|uniref:hypothetical protein n=1 Tax=unclassified Kitasatospora TaxID=2633591 RepID=UPI00371DBC71
MTTAEHAVDRDHTAVENDVAGLDQLNAQQNPDPVKVSAAEAGLAADRRQLSYDEKRLSDLQHKYDQECAVPPH